MIQGLKKTIENERGFALGTAILVSAIMILAGTFAIWTANTELHMVRNESEMISEFYSAEAGAVDAMENYNNVDVPTNWLTTAFLLAGDDANNTANYNDDDGNAVATVEVRCILDEAYDTTLGDSADNLPLQDHIGPPPPDSGYSIKYFEVRRYGITATSTNGNTRIQVGVYKVFNKF